MDGNMDFQLFTIAQAAAALAIAPDTLRRWIKRHGIPIIRLGRKTLLTQETCRAIVRNGLPVGANDAQGSEHL